MPTPRIVVEHTKSLRAHLANLFDNAAGLKRNAWRRTEMVCYGERLLRQSCHGKRIVGNHISHCARRNKHIALDANSHLWAQGGCRMERDPVGSAAGVYRCGDQEERDRWK